jgi:histone deacetylase 1/2
VQTLAHTFPIKDLGHIEYFLGIKAKYVSSGMIITQHKYAQDLLYCNNMEGCRSMSTPISLAKKLSRAQGDTLSSDDAFKYRSLVGGLQYLTLTRPDILFAIKKVCQFFSQPTTVHYEAINRILRYVKGIVSTGLLIQKAPSDSLNILYRC